MSFKFLFIAEARCQVVQICVIGQFRRKTECGRVLLSGEQEITSFYSLRLAENRIRKCHTNRVL